MSTALAKPDVKQSLIVTMANRYGLEQGKFLATIEKTIFPANSKATLEQTAAFLVVANQYELNPFIKEIYAFPGRNGGIVPIVSVDGWLTLINRQPQLDGIEFEDHVDGEGRLSAVTCRIFRKDRSHPTEVTEYMEECKRATDTWGKWPSRMLRHKALIQCARYAFGFAGIYDPDEAERIAENDPEPAAAQVAQRTREKTEVLKGRLRTAAAPPVEVEPQAQAVDEDETNEPKPAMDEAAEKKRLRKSIKDHFSEEQIEKHTGKRDIHALSLDELVTLKDALTEDAD